MEHGSGRTGLIGVTTGLSRLTACVPAVMITPSSTGTPSFKLVLLPAPSACHPRSTAWFRQPQSPRTVVRHTQPKEPKAKDQHHLFLLLREQLPFSLMVHSNPGFLLNANVLASPCSGLTEI